MLANKLLSHGLHRKEKLFVVPMVLATCGCLSIETKQAHKPTT
jgi:hypothetical protein